MYNYPSCGLVFLQNRKLTHWGTVLGLCPGHCYQVSVEMKMKTPSITILCSELILNTRYVHHFFSTRCTLGVYMYICGVLPLLSATSTSLSHVTITKCYPPNRLTRLHVSKDNVLPDINHMGKIFTNFKATLNSDNELLTIIAQIVGKVLLEL